MAGTVDTSASLSPPQPSAYRCFTLDAGDEDNTITFGDGNNIIYGTSSNDVITAGDGNNTIYAGDGKNTITLGDGDNVIYGGSSADVITTGDGDNQIFAGDGNNKIATGAGDDLIYSGSGDDLIAAGKGSNTVWLGGGHDTIVLEFRGFTKINNFNVAETKIDLSSIGTKGVALASLGSDTLVVLPRLSVLATLTFVDVATVSANSESIFGAQLPIFTA
ncbi:MAG: calcium-binding protein [Scytonema sp. PMC 1069.18]|nr:calcium-binding protein [Scytonema sp. PMC 1069.18]MEC4884135.1 calcium-binding protein [Scytonema sp. PMC 1070.18]